MGEIDRFIQAVSIEDIIDQFSAIIGIDAKDRARQAVTQGQDGLKNSRLGAIGHCTAFCPARTDIGGGQGIEKLTFHTVSTVCHQVYFQKTGLPLIPIKGGSDLNGLFEQGSRFGGAESIGVVEPFFAQTTIDGGSAHLAQMA